MKAFFIFDVESIGLFGEGFAVAGGVYLENGAAQSEFCYACRPDSAFGDEAGRQWVSKNVPVLTETHSCPERVRETFWMEWMRAKAEYKDIAMAVECGWPVETAFIIECVKASLDERELCGPYPLHEIASFMAAAGMDPEVTYSREPSEMPAHNPLADARLSARLLAEALKRLEGKTVEPCLDAKDVPA